ncbi:Hypothetical predicted protein [Mytilus galloprovincialis]|uniref:DDE Tnp4 domain-containing protein n=1 Tax=Mytilus galloprovincialis TaxID=29158 RepID=A0A8B6GV79_MYTGA|nr:Hypothetical predicted protein [Mytilus galloprovincialis]
MPLNHEYINPIPYNPTFCDSETQTDLSMNNIFELEANLKQMKVDQENLVKTEEKPCLTAEFVDKITSADKNVSSYLGIPSVMALLGIFGAFNFISNLWCGNVSDRYITEHSEFLDNIKAGDEVMTERGFLIRDLLLERKATLNIPPFTKKMCSRKR